MKKLLAGVQSGEWYDESNDDASMALAVKSGIDEKRSLSAALGDKITKFQHLTIDHKFDKFLLVLFHFFLRKLVVSRVHIHNIPHQAVKTRVAG